VVEGATTLAAAIDAGWEIEAQFVAPGAEPLVGAGGAVHHLAPNVLERVASTEAPQPVLAIVRMRSTGHADLARATFVVVADRVADPGNMGTILRSAEAAGADAVVLTPGTVDVFNPKAVRASAGALFHVPVANDVTIHDVARVAPQLTILGTSSHRGDAYDAVDLRRPLALVVGGEAHGLDPDAPVDAWVRVPHRGRAESLNVAMATTVVVFEIARQRRAG
jgi:TrmH family RNA methyltransferase